MTLSPQAGRGGGALPGNGHDVRAASTDTTVSSTPASTSTTWWPPSTGTDTSISTFQASTGQKTILISRTE
jgi:hypothetical protein